LAQAHAGSQLKFVEGGDDADGCGFGLGCAFQVEAGDGVAGFAGDGRRDLAADGGARLTAMDATMRVRIYLLDAVYTRGRSGG
jgi:hypothetical protein